MHILPPFPSSADRGFAPIAYDQIEPAFGTWADIETLSSDHDVMLDLMVNHVSRQSPEFRDFEQHGRSVAERRPVRDHGEGLAGRQPRTEDVARIFLRKPDAPFSSVEITDTGESIRSGPRSGPLTGPSRSTWT